MADRRTPFRIVLALATAGCALVALAFVGKVPLDLPFLPSDGWVSPSRYTQLADNPNPPPRNRTVMVPNQFDVVTAPRRMLRTRTPNLVVRGTGVEQWVGGAISWSATYRSLPGWDGRITLPAIAALVAGSPNPDWIKETEPGVYLLTVGMVQSPGTRLEVTAPRVRELRLASRPYVYVAGAGASALFQDVKVTSWDPATGQPARNPADRRPFVSYHRGGRLDIVRSELAYLGTDASRAYGVSWGLGTTGSAIGSDFHHNLFGAYTGGAVGVVFRDNVFRQNARYGLDPHTDSTGLVVVGNEAYANNTQGIIFSTNVTRSLVEGNRSHDNGANGIMMDDRSTGNVIRNNEVRNNRGDGIVLQGSSDNQVVGNTVTGNSVAIRVNANRLGPTDGSRVVGNEITGNRHGIQVYGGTRDTVTRGNRITRTADQAINFVDPGVSESDTVIGALKAVVAEGDATVRSLTTTDVGRGVVAGPGARVTVEASRLTGEEIAVDVQPGGHLDLAGTAEGASTVSAAQNAVVVGGILKMRNVTISDARRGVLVGPDGRASITSTTILTSGKGVEVQGVDGSDRVQVALTDIAARKPLVGAPERAENNRVRVLPSWLGVAGGLFLLLAVLLHLGHRVGHGVGRWSRLNRWPRPRLNRWSRSAQARRSSSSVRVPRDGVVSSSASARSQLR
jgi:parallel beta-helix repeat protein